MSSENAKSKSEGANDIEKSQSEGAKDIAKSDKYIYHYTDAKGAKGIETSQKIYASKDEDGDALFGQGVYLTPIKPSASKEKILQNNYDGTAHLNRGRADYVVAINKSDVAHDVVRAKTERDVIVYPNDDLDISKIKHKIREQGESISQSVSTTEESVSTTEESVSTTEESASEESVSKSQHQSQYQPGKSQHQGK